MTPAITQPREIGPCDRRTTGRIGEVVCLRANEKTNDGLGRLVRVALDPGALDVLADEPSREKVDGLFRLFDEGRITVLPPGAMATVEEFDVSPAGRWSARLKVGLLAGRGLSAWCLMRPSGDPLPPAGPPIARHLLEYEPDLRALRARHPQYFARASESEAKLLDLLFLSRGSIEVLVLALRDDFEPQGRAEHDRHARAQEAQFVELRQRVESTPAFLSLPPVQQAAIRRELFQIDFEKDPFK